MPTTDPLDTLQDARRRGVSWPVIIEALQTLEANGPGDKEGRRWISVVAERTGYTANQLRQAGRALGAVHKLLSSPNARAAALGWPITSLEVVARIALLDPEHARDLLTRSVVPTIRDLRSIYERVRVDEGARLSPQSAGHHAARTLNRAIVTRLSEPTILQHILGPRSSLNKIRLMAWPGGFRYAHPSFLAIEDNGLNVRLHAFQGLRLTGDLNHDGATKAVVRAAVEGTFFATYHLVLTRRTDSDILHVMSAELELQNLGVVALADGLPEVLVRPPGVPYPNRQGMLLSDAQLCARLGIKPLKETRSGKAF